MTAQRKDNDPPAAVARWGWRYHHLGIPYDTPRPDEQHVPHLKIHVSGFESSACGIQWMRFDADCALPQLVRTVPHVAFEVDDLDRALEGQQLLVAPNSPSPGVRVAMIVDTGAPVELLEFARKRSEQ